MRSYLKWAAVPAGLLLASLAAHGELDRWVQDIETGSKLEGVFFRAFPVAVGTVVGRRPPKETRVELSKLIAQAPAEADLLSLRALEAEKQLDFVSAETDWKKYVELAKDKAAANLSLADYYHRRLMPREEIAALRAVSTSPAFERIITLIDEQAMDASVAVEQYRAWVARSPKDAETYRRACTALIQKKQFGAAEQILTAYQREFPALVDFPTQARAAIELVKGSPDRALGVYERSFRPLWSDELVAGYFALLKEQGHGRTFVDQTRAQIAANPGDLNASARIYYYFRQQNDSGNAARALVEFRKHKTSWTAAEHETLATLFERTNQYDDAARHYHALYVHSSATAAQAEMALAGLVDLLLTAPEQPIQIGAGDLSFYRDIAAMDRSPGYLNGVLSLLLNSASPSNEYANQDAQALTYFHRVKAAQLDVLFESKYPKSGRRAGLRAKLIQAYATYGDTKTVIDSGREFLPLFPDAPSRTEVALSMADAYARLERPDEEFALYRQLLVELAANAGGRPIGVVETPAPEPDENGAPRVAKPDAGVRSQDYVRVLDRYLARLVSLNRMADALRVYRGELTRNASDPGLYERFAAFLDQNKLGAEIERVYRDAMQKFPDDTQWSHRLARWYLRGQQRAKYTELTRQVTKIFSGTDLEAYLNETSGDKAVGAQLYLQVNEYAHQRFPHNLAFVSNLLAAYTARGTANPVAYEKLLRENWYHEAGLRARFFELLSRTRRLDAELATLRNMKPDADANPAAARMLAEGEVWKTNYEAAAQPFQLLAASLPANAQIDERAANLHRSLNRADLAIQIESNLAKAEPRNREVLTRIGEIEADRERYDRAALPWVKMASIEPGKPEGYLESATVFWDYFQFADAFRMIEQARVKLGNASLYAYEAGAIRENQRDYEASLNEYAKGALAEGAGRCRDRLLRLAKRPSLAAQAEAITTRIGSSQNPASIGLRISFLEGQKRKADLQRYLSDTAAAATSPDVISLVEGSARANEMPLVLRLVYERRVANTADPVERLRARMELARFFETQGDAPKAAETVDALYREYPTTLGIIRGTVNYYSRVKQPGRAVDLLVATANTAQQPYQDRFRFEAAQKAIEAGLYDRGQPLINALLEKEPYRADYLALAGDVYARQGDDAGLRTYYLNTIASLSKAPLPADERIARVASLRRSFIPVLNRLKDYAGALDQYIEVINRYPEDESVVREAALFALQNGQRQRLTDFYTKTAGTASRDHRWPIVLSRIETQAENFPAALEWLGKARAIRPERTDFLAAKGPLEERLMRFEDAAKTYMAMWDLTYHDPQWMVKCAEQYERLGRHADTISAIRRAYIDGRPESPSNYLAAAAQAEKWNLLDAAQEFVAKGTPKNPSLQALEGVLAVRRHTAMPAPVKDMDAMVAERWGDAVMRYATPEEKAALAQRLTPSTSAQVARAAGFIDLLAKWEPEVIEGAINPRWIQMQKQRGKIDEIGPRLESASKNGTLSGQQRDALLGWARSYYAQAGDSAAELHMLEQRRATGMRDGGFIARYAELASRDQEQALAIVGSDPAAAMRDAVANQVLMKGNAADSLAVIQARGAALKPVWNRAYTALAGVYFDLKTPQVRGAFEGLLGPRTIGEQLARRPNMDQEVTGGPWYYYASRYGEYLADEDYVLAQLEASPQSTAGYAGLAEFYQDKQDPARALREYDYWLQLDPASPTPHARKASVLAAQGNLAAAVAEWKLAANGFGRELDSNPLATWWSDLAGMLSDVSRYKALGSLRDDMSRVLRLHFSRYGAYNSEVLIDAIYEAAGADWLAELSRSAPEPNQILDLALTRIEMPDAARDSLYAREVEYAQAKLNGAMGNDRPGLREALVTVQLQRIRDAMARGGLDTAERLLKELPAQIADTHMAELAAIQIRIAAKQGTLDSLLARYQRDAEHAPGVDILQQAATELHDAKDEANSSRVLEFLYSRELANRNFTGPNFLGLSEVKLGKNDLPGALDLLQRMNLMVGAPFEFLNDSATLLWQTGHNREAAEYLDQLVEVQPWDPDHRMSAALVKLETGDSAAMTEFAAIANNGLATYANRVRAAQALRKSGGSDQLNSGVPELNWIAGKTTITEAQASQPYYIASRLMAAEATPDAAMRFRLLSAAILVSPQPRYQFFQSAVEVKRWWLANSLIDESRIEGRSPRENIDMLRSLAEVKRQVGEPDRALQYQTQLSSLLSGAEKASLEKAIAAQRTELDLRNRNNLRRPIINESLMPDRIVKPRLVASAGGAQ